MSDGAADGSTGSLTRVAAGVQTLEQLAALLRTLRRRHARHRRDRELTYRDLAERTGWSLTSIAEYFTARRLPPTDRFDALLVLLGADPAEQGALASARDRIDERRRASHPPQSGSAAAGAPAATAAPDSRPPGRRVDGSVRHGATGGTRSVVPRQLPPATRHFNGRRRELAQLAELAGSARMAGTVVITAIGGTAGVGKTTLALYWAHRVAGQFPDGHLYVNLRGFDPHGWAMDPVAATRGFLDALAVPPFRIPADPDAQTALYRSVLADKRMLIVLDNARDAAQVRPLLPAAPGCLVVVTSRNLLSSLIAAEGAHPITLDVFTPAEAREALATRLGTPRMAAEPAAVDTITECCAGLPLALAVVAARARTSVERPLASVARELADARDRLDVLADHDPYTDVRAVFSWSYRALSTPAAGLFRLLSLHPGPDVTVPAAAALAAVTPPEAEALLTELTSASLIAERRPGRYAYHDLLRAYAAHLARITDSEPDRHAATGRVFDHYLRTAHAANRLLDAAADAAPPDPPGDEGTAVRFTDYRQALDWFTAEHAVLLNTVEHASAAGWQAPVGQLVEAVAVYLDRQAHWHDGVTVWRTAVRSADRTSDRAAQARAHRQLGRAYTRLYQFDDAGLHLHRALELASRTGDRAEQADVNHTLAIMCERRGDLDRALFHSHRALDLYLAVGHRLGQAKAYNAIGWHLTLLGDHEQALVYCDRALTLLRQLGDRTNQAHTLDSLGHAHHQLGQHSRATACYEQALDLHREFGDRFSEAEALEHLGDIHHDYGDAIAARRSWQQALDILDELAHPSSDQVRGKLAASAGHPLRATAPS
ncbi:ATP-binding protein [Rugosimonospora africana]|uniref:SARP family transcriptional regulator n=1 Tax=Rugosimonospora africana TaxID=556532 RepID=A0A8J3R3L2_9ACTN|nr:tetratricopeptide repeat protein [Rugosimonospora africana]GIH19491.1 SARP family transcriptional regulator [Rugosimonospora africana]